MTLVYYLFNRFLHRLLKFLQRWYFGSFKIYSHFIFSLLERVDRKLAFKITLRNLFKPLYQDESFIGHILGFCFRTVRLMAGGIIYIILITIFILIYLAWLAAPLYIIFKIFYPNF